MRKVIIIVTGLAILALANYSLYSREQLLTEGRTVLLQLAPVDPRSLMQGDYMALQFSVSNLIFDVGGAQQELRDGYIVLTLGANAVGTFARFDDTTPLADNEMRMRYRVRKGLVKFATDAFFFQEGDADVYAAARYGEFRVAKNGAAILVGLRDAGVMPLGRTLQ